MNLGPLTPRERHTLLGLALVYAAVAIPVGIHRGGDLVQEILQSDRLLRGLPLYGQNPEKGVCTGPHSRSLPWTPSPRSSDGGPWRWPRASWAVFNVWCVVWCLAYTGRRWSWGVAVISLLAVAKPLQANFEHQNITVVLLYFVMLCHRALGARGGAREESWWVGAGVATALKAFPGLLLVYFLIRRRWKALASGVVVAGALTVGAMIRYGAFGALERGLELVHHQPHRADHGGVRYPASGQSAARGPGTRYTLGPRHRGGGRIDSVLVPGRDARGPRLGR